MERPDLLVVGAGPVGCVVAERAATELGWRCLVIDRRPHVAGNCYDAPHDGVLVHRYGPHYFRTDDRSIVDYLSRFTEWIPGNYVVKSSVGGRLFPFPINLTTLELFFGRSLTPAEAQELLARQREPRAQPRNSEELVLSRVGRELYEAFYLGYTLKQWGRHPRELEPSVCGRVPVRFDRDERYVDAAYQLTPKEGFTRMFTRLLDHPRIEVRTAVDFRALRHELRPRRATVYTGPIDEYFDRRLGALPWRSLDFSFQTFAEELRQPCVQINYPDQHPYTRSVEIKHVTGQRHPHTVISYEVPRAEGEPYYPVPEPASARLLGRYQELARAETAAHRVYFSGRLATYRYLNTDEAVAGALRTFELLRRDVAAREPAA